jgi:hypothetical protein
MWIYTTTLPYVFIAYYVYTFSFLNRQLGEAEHSHRTRLSHCRTVDVACRHVWKLRLHFIFYYLMRHESYGRRTTDVAVCVASLRVEALCNVANDFSENCRSRFSTFLDNHVLFLIFRSRVRSQGSVKFIELERIRLKRKKDDGPNRSPTWVCGQQLHKDRTLHLVSSLFLDEILDNSNFLYSNIFSLFTAYIFIFPSDCIPYQLWCARDSVVGWGTMLQAGRSRVRFPMSSLDFSIYLILPGALWSSQLLAEMSTRNLLGDKGRLERKVDNLAAICEPTV